MIHPLDSLAVAVHGSPGAYAVLLGSGVSVGAGVPTGWGVVQDLVSKVARLQGVDPGDDPASWYQDEFGTEPEYSTLLEALAKSPTERSMLLRSYFEPTLEERARGIKIPSRAHRSLAKLAAAGTLRLFLTTNFDRLMEQALEDAGIVPTVLSTPDSVRGAPPLAHSGCTVIKLHGDYRDTRIRNTPAELEAYDEIFEALLDRILGEHGLIVCGWSAAWDGALWRAFERAPVRRYTTFWADVVPPGEHAARLIDAHKAEFLLVKDSDTLFNDLEQKVQLLAGPEVARAPSVAHHAREAKHNLPVQLTSLIGRETEVAEVQRHFSDSRLVTLTGSGGTGKTRLAQEIGVSSIEAHADGVWFVGLAPLTDPNLVTGEVAGVLGVGEDALFDYLEDKSTLLILDNCEHLVEACAEFAGTLLQRARTAKVLATSQETLGIPGEVVHRVPPLRVAASPDATVEALFDCEAVRLFVERAATVQPGFTLTDQNAAAVAQITRSLDGIPLAIELAAARANVLSPEQIADRLEDSFELLTRGRRAAVPRHQTLRGVLEWSYELLSEQERALFNRLSVFRGGFTLEAAEQVCSGDGLESREVLDLLSQLFDKSFVVVEQVAEREARYRLLEVLRIYGAERLGPNEGAADVRSRHAAFFLSLAERAEPELFTAQQATWLARLEDDYDNFRAGMAWALESGQGETALRTAAALTWFWIFHRHVSDGQDWMERAVRHDADAPPKVRAGGTYQSRPPAREETQGF